MKKAICFLMAFLVLLLPNVIYADAGGHGDNEASTPVIDMGTKETPTVFDPENELINKKKTEAALELRILELKTSYTANVTVYPQIVGYYCGPASAYMVIKSWGFNVPSTTRALFVFNGCPANCPYPSTPHTC